MQRLPYKQRKPVFDALGIKFTDAQLAFIKEDVRFPVIGGGERGGKSFCAAADQVPHYIWLPKERPERFFNKDGTLKFNENVDRPRNPDFLLIGPTYAEPRIEFQYIEDWLRKLGMLAGGLNKPSKPQDGPWRMVTKHGVVIQTWSMEDPTSIRALDLEGVLVCEAGKCPYSGIERLQGRVSAKRGYIVYSGTMENSQQWYQDWMLMGQRPNHLGIKSYSLPTFSNTHEFPGGRNDPEILRLERMYPEDIFAMRVLAEPRPPKARVIAEAQNRHIKKVKIPHDAEFEVWVDPGYATAYAVLWVAHWLVHEDGQEPYRFFYVFDEIYERGKTTEDIIAMCKARKLWSRVKEGVIDIAGKGHRDATESALEIWKKRTRLVWNMKMWPEKALIERIRTTFKQNHIAISPACRGLIAELGLGEPVFDEMHYWKYMTDRDGKVVGEKPVDKWNHSAKALGYGLLHHLGQVERVSRAVPISRMQRASVRIRR